MAGFADAAGVVNRDSVVIPNDPNRAFGNAKCNAPGAPSPASGRATTVDLRSSRWRETHSRAGPFKYKAGTAQKCVPARF
jgi:hypothetical protein